MTTSNEAIKKRVGFSLTLSVVLVPCKQEFTEAGLKESLWWSSGHFQSSVKVSLAEISILAKARALDMKTARRQLYQPCSSDQEDPFDAIHLTCSSPTTSSTSSSSFISSRTCGDNIDCVSPEDDDDYYLDESTTHDTILTSLGLEEEDDTAMFVTQGTSKSSSNSISNASLHSCPGDHRDLYLCVDVLTESLVKFEHKIVSLSPHALTPISLSPSRHRLSSTQSVPTSFLASNSEYITSRIAVCSAVVLTAVVLLGGMF